MAKSADLALFRAERDALAFLGVISSLHLRFDPPIVAAGIEQPQPTHFHGLNVHALMIDNVDGEVLALEQNQIHAHQSPVEHGEQRALRTAIARVGQKRPRAAATTVEEYYRSQLFYGTGETEGDYLKQGATIYTSLEPCPMCATTILVCRVKRTVFLLQDHKFGGAWTTIKDKFYPDNKLTYGQLDLSYAKLSLIRRAHNINRTMGRKVEALHKKKVPDTLFFDHLTDELRAGFRLFCGVTDRDLATKGEQKSANARTLRDLKRFCNIPSAN
jgi:tRNA(Arg) A34 adenosine deaminase TadA